MQIDDRCWMAENLRYVGEGENSCLTSGGYENCNLDEWVEEPYTSCCVHNSESISYYYSQPSILYKDWDEPQVLYQWGAVIDLKNFDQELPADLEKLQLLFERTQGICPKGWVVPSQEDFDYLGEYIDETYSTIKIHDDYNWVWIIGTDGGKKLKSAIYSDGTDEYGFNALPTGFRRSNGILSYVGSYTSWWTSLIDEWDGKVWWTGANGWFFTY